MKRRDREPGTTIRVATYEDMHRFAKALAEGDLNLLIVMGDPGLGKSQIVRQAVGPDVCWIEGNASAFGIYVELFRHRDELVIFDDVDGLVKDPAAVRLLKALCQTDPEKTIRWQKAATALGREGVPGAFTTTSNAAIIANDWDTVNANVGAVEDRGHVVAFEPDALEVHRYVSTWFDDEEVFDFIGERLHLVEKPSARHYVTARELKRAGFDWKSLLLQRLLSGTDLLVGRIKADPKYRSDEERVQAFLGQGGDSAATYFERVQHLHPVALLPRIVLAGSTPAQPDSARERPAAAPDEPAPAPHKPKLKPYQQEIYDRLMRRFLLPGQE